LKNRILVVDDSPSVSGLIKDILSHRGYKVELANDGETALQKYRNSRPDIVTLDLGMSGIGGYDVLKRLLDIDKNATVIIVTANPYATLEECLKLGAAGLVEKPFRPDQLVSAIEQTLHKETNSIAEI
jgi:two-component system chemotaxis response regulator CheY